MVLQKGEFLVLFFLKEKYNTSYPEQNQSMSKFGNNKSVKFE